MSITYARELATSRYVARCLLKCIWQRKLKQATTLEDAKQIYDANRIYLGLNDTFRDLRDVAESEKKVNQLRDNPTLKTAIRDEQQQIRRQREIETRLNSLLTARERSRGEDGKDSERPNEGLDPDTRLQECSVSCTSKPAARKTRANEELPAASWTAPGHAK